MTVARYRAYARDVTRRNLGEIPDYGELVFQPRFDDVGGWHLTASAASRAAALLTKTGGIIITRNNLDGTGPQVVFSGTVTTFDLDAVTLEVAGSSDELVLSEKAASPDPSTVGPPDGMAFATEQDLRQGTASTVMLAYVKANTVTGFAATSTTGRNRAVPGLAIGPDLGVGKYIYGQARWESLLALMQDLALAGGANLTVGSLRFQVLQTNTSAATLMFTVTQPTDRTATVVISKGRGTLGTWKRSVSRPAATVVYTLGQGQGINRQVLVGSDAAASTEYGYEIEAVDDRRDVSDSLTLQQANENALVDSGEEAIVTFTPIDTPSMRWGVEYDLGDLVSIVTQNAATGDDETLVEIVRGVDVTLTAPGAGGSSTAVVQPIVSTPGDTTDDPTSRQQRAVSRRVSNLERNVDSLASALTVQWNVGDLRLTTRGGAAAGWLLCNGQAVSRVTYSGLFGIIGTTYGAGDGSTTFNVPDLRDRVQIGAGLSYALASRGGSTTVDSSHSHAAGTLTVPNHSHAAGTLAGPSHTHTGPSHTHAAGTLTGPSHTHGAGTLIAPNHAHTAGTLTMPNHSHAAGTLIAPNHAHTAGALTMPNHSHAAGTLAGPSHTHTTPAHSHAATALGVGGATGGTASATNQANVTTPATAFALGAHSHDNGTLDVTGTIGPDGGGTSGASGTGSVTGSTASDGTALITGTSNGQGDQSVTGSTASDGTALITGTSNGQGDQAVTGSSAAGGTGSATGSTAADGTQATGASGTGSVTGSTATDGTATVTGSSATAGSTTLSIVQPYVAVTFEIYAAV